MSIVDVDSKNDLHPIACTIDTVEVLVASYVGQYKRQLVNWRGEKVIMALNHDCLLSPWSLNHDIRYGISISELQRRVVQEWAYLKRN